MRRRRHAVVEILQPAVLALAVRYSLEEVTARSPVLHLGTVAVPFAALAGFVAAQDPQAFRRAGFVVSPAFGLAFDPAEPPWVTVLAAHCLAEWRAL